MTAVTAPLASRLRESAMRRNDTPWSVGGDDRRKLAAAMAVLLVIIFIIVIAAMSIEVLIGEYARFASGPDRHHKILPEGVGRKHQSLVDLADQLPDILLAQVLSHA